MINIRTIPANFTKIDLASVQAVRATALSSRGATGRSSK